MKSVILSSLNSKQREETAKVFLHIAEVILIALIARQFIPVLAKELTILDNMYGGIVVLCLYILAMRLLKTKI